MSDLIQKCDWNIRLLINQNQRIRDKPIGKYIVWNVHLRRFKECYAKNSNC